MIQLKNITLRNFLSVGSVTQAIDLHNQELTLILGENLDLGGDGARNGTGKTTLIQAISYALYGTALNNIKQNNLINRTNGKGMLVTLDFVVNGVEYRIERGRKPHGLKFFINGHNNEEDNEAQGENKETQGVIDKIINISPTMFRNIVALNTYSQPFLSMTQGQQRDVIEQLLGITLLSEKAEQIKIKIKVNKEDLQQEEFKIKAIEEANKRIHEQIDSLVKRAKLWDAKKNEDVLKLKEELEVLKTLDIEAELLGHKELSTYNQRKKEHEDIDKTMQRTRSDLDKESKTVTKLEKEIETLRTNKCYACGQDFHDDSHANILVDKEKLLEEANERTVDLAEFYVECEKEKEKIGEIGSLPKLYYDTEQEAFEHRNKVDNLLNQIDQRENDTNPYTDQIEDMQSQA